jgi:F-type H+-transporting ATPase subunit delta
MGADMPEAIAERYARALVEAIGPEGDYRRVSQDLKSFASVYKESSELREVLQSPIVTPDQKTKVIEAILRRLDASPVTTNFLRVLMRHYRINLLDEIHLSFQNIIDERLGVLKMRVTSAAPLSRDQQEELRERFGKLTRKTVEVEYEIDPNVLGGVLAQVKSTVYDGTIRGYLQRIREEMEAG